MTAKDIQIAQRGPGEAAGATIAGAAERGAAGGAGATVCAALDIGISLCNDTN
jgi:hypothetical protein